MADASRTGADALAEALPRLTGRPMVFLVTGNQNLPLVDALGRRDVPMVHARHESGAGYMAEGWARSSGQPGVYLVTAGPGLTSALTPLASARAAEVPVILLSASHPRAQDGMGAFQELGQAGLTRPLCKSSLICLNGDRAAAALGWAWQRATEFPPGPVHVELPADVLTGPAPRDVPLSAADLDGAGPDGAGPDGAGSDGAGPGLNGAAAGHQARQIADALLAAERPLVLLRPALGRLAAARELRRHVPVLVAESPRGLRDPAWAGQQDLIATADRIALLAPPDYAVDFGRVGTGEVWTYPDAGPALLGELASLLGGRDEPGPGPGAAETSLPAGPPASEAAGAPGGTAAAGGSGGPLHPLAVAEIVDGLAGPDDVLVIDGGEFCQWIRHGLRGRAGQQLVNGKLGAIGGSIPLAVGASLHAPGRRHVVFTGDGSFGYYSAEIDTAVRHGARLTIVVGVDGSWGSEWHQQQARFGGRTYTTAIGERRYGLVAQGYGARGADAADAGEFGRLLADGLAWPSVSCVSVRIERVASPAA
jgi:acetolactate synthase I/II/III large subunit